MDIADHAKELENRLHQQALQAHYANRPNEQPSSINGIRHCLDCGNPIPSARLKALPTAVRHTKCQQTHEQRKNHGS